jgi:putative phosphoesterase
MKIGILSDAHGNSIGTHNCLEFLKSEGVEHIIFLGDCVGYMPAAEEVIDELSQAHAICLRGNHEEILLGNSPLDELRNEVYKIREVQQTLDKIYFKKIERWATSFSLNIDNKNLFFIHGSPWDYTNGYVYADLDLTKFEKLPYNAVFMGHTHRPFIKQTSNILTVNVGSCGLPRDVGSLSSCAVYDTVKNECILFRIPFDEEAVIRLYKDKIHPSVIDCLYRKEC